MITIISSILTLIGGTYIATILRQNLLKERKVTPLVFTLILASIYFITFNVALVVTRFVWGLTIIALRIAFIVLGIAAVLVIATLIYERITGKKVLTFFRTPSKNDHIEDAHIVDVDDYKKNNK